MKLRYPATVSSPGTRARRAREVALPFAISLALVVTAIAQSALAQTSLPFGINGGWDWVNLVNGITRWNVVGNAAFVSEDANGNPTTDFGATIIDSRKNMPFAGPDQLGINEDISGAYLVSFQGKATITPNTEITNGPIGATVQNQSYDSGSNTTTAQVVLQPGFGLLQIVFTGTQATASSATNTGVTGLKVLRPGYPLNTTQVFTAGSLQYFKNAPFVNDRFLGPDGIGDYSDFTDQTVNSVTWDGRVKVTDAHQQGTLVENSNFQQAHGVAWEYIIQFANATNTDIWINIPDLADSNYVQQLATLILNGNQYTAGLKPNLRVYFEQGNEDWNSSTQPAIANTILAGRAGISQTQEIVAHTIANAKIFQSVFSETGATGRVRPVVDWQYTQQLSIFDALQWWENTNNDKVSKYIYGIGEAPYYNPDDYSSVQSIFDTQYNNSDRTRRDFIGWQAVAAYHGLKEVGYESGPSLSIGPSAAAIRDARIIPSVRHHFIDNFFAVGGDLVNYFAAQDHINYFSDWLTVEDFEHYDTPTFAGVLGILNASQPPLTAGQVLPWSVGQTVVIDPSQVVNSPFGSDLAPNAAITIGQGSDNLYLLRATGSGIYSVSFYAGGASGNSTTLNAYVDDNSIGSVNVSGSAGSTSSLSFSVGAGFHALSLVETGSTGVVFPAGSGAITISLSSGSGTAVVPSAPANLQIKSGDGQAALSWATTATASSYTVSRSTVSGGPFTAVATTASNNYTDTGLTNGTTYYYVVQAINGVGTGANSPQASVYPGPTTLPSAPAAPSVAAAGGDGGLFYSPGIAIVSWSAVPNAFGYKVYKSTNGGSFSQVNQNYDTDGYNQQNNSPQAALQWTDRFVNNGDSVSYTVSAVNANGEGAQSSAGSATATLTTRPAPVLSITQQDGFNLLTWVPDPLWNPQFAPAFNVKRSTQSGGPYTTIIQINSDSAYDYTAVPNTTYYYVVTQVNSAGEGAASNEVDGSSSTVFTPGNCGGDTTPVPYPSVPATNAGCGAPGAGGQTNVDTSTSLTISPSGSLTTGQSYTLTATVSASSGTATPSGNVVFSIGSSTQSVALNSSGVAVYNGTAPSSAGTLALSAAYSGTSGFNSSNSNSLNVTITSGGTTGGGPIAIPNYSFEQGGAGYNVPSNWSFASSGTSGNNYAVQYISNATNPPAADGSNYWSPGDFNPSTQPYGTSTATLTTSAPVGTFAASTTYNLTVAVADPADGTDPSTKSIGFQLLANGSPVATFASTSIPQGGNFQDYSLSFDTAANASVVGQNITIALVYSYSGQYNRNAYFDNVRLNAAADSGTGGTPSASQVNLSSASNAIGITNDNVGFSGGGIDGDGYVYSAQELGRSLTDSAETLFNLGVAGQNDVVTGNNGPSIALTQGKYSTLKFLGLGVNGNQSGTFTVTYSDNSSDQFTRGLSDWFASAPQSQETIAGTYAYRDNNQGAQAGGPLNIYEYVLPLNNSKTVSNLTLPNNRNIVVVAVTLLP